MRIVIVDDHKAVAEALGLAFQPANEIVGVVTERSAVLGWLRNHTVDLLLIDSTLPRCDLYDLIRTIHHQQPVFAIVVMSSYSGRAEWPGLHRMGARGVVSKALPLDDFIQTACELAHKPSKTPPPDDAGSSVHPTPRELDYVIATGRGGGRKQVAKELGIHEDRVDELCAESRHKLCALSRPHMLLRAVEEDWIEPRVPPPLEH